jgi:hypothetical protein
MLSFFPSFGDFQHCMRSAPSLLLHLISLFCLDTKYIASSCYSDSEMEVIQNGLHGDSEILNGVVVTNSFISNRGEAGALRQRILFAS